MADFAPFLPKLLKFEGGFVSHPADPGGATNKGVTLQTWRECSLELLDIAPSLDSLRALTDAQAGVIYKLRYWDALRGDEIRHQALAEMLVDFHVNAGRNAVRTLQAVLNEVGSPALAEDGVFGEATFARLCAANAPTLQARLRAARIAYYKRLADARPALKVFLAGWLNRVDALADKP